jgi:hypothetical protein
MKGRKEGGEREIDERQKRKEKKKKRKKNCKSGILATWEAEIRRIS